MSTAIKFLNYYVLVRKMKMFNDDHIEFLRLNCKGISCKELTDLFNARFNTELTIQQIYHCKKNHHLKSGLTGRFVKRQAPPNKGKKWNEYMSVEGQIKALKTTFTKGNIPHNHRPLGSERIDSKDGYILIKVKEPRTWKHKHVYLWEKVYGPKPKGSAVIFADRNKRNFSLDNLILVKRSELLILNKKQLIFEHADLTRSGVLISKVILKREHVKHQFVSG